MTKDLCPFLDAAWDAGSVHPPKEDVFKAFDSTSFDDVRVVIVGNGAGFAFADRGIHELRGVPEARQLYAVR
jgi:hypothetical protein